MKLDKNKPIAGQPAAKVRRLMRYVGLTPLTVKGIAERLEVSGDVARGFVAAMLDAGFLERSERSPDKYTTTQIGGQLAAALFMKRLDRAKADWLVAGLLDRADAINADSDLVYRVAAIDAFGSYITNTDDIGDIDVTVTLEFKREKGSIVEANKARAEASGRVSMSYDRELTFGEHEVKQRLRARSPYISIVSEMVVADAPKRRIYPRAPRAGVTNGS